MEDSDRVRASLHAPDPKLATRNPTRVLPDVAGKSLRIHSDSIENCHHRGKLNVMPLVTSRIHIVVEKRDQAGHERN